MDALESSTIVTQAVIIDYGTVCRSFRKEIYSTFPSCASGAMCYQIKVMCVVFVEYRTEISRGQAKPTYGISKMNTDQIQNAKMRKKNTSLKFFPRKIEYCRNFCTMIRQEEGSPGALGRCVRLHDDPCISEQPMRQRQAKFVYMVPTAKIGS